MFVLFIKSKHRQTKESIQKLQVTNTSHQSSHAHYFEMKLLQVLRASYACILCLLHLQVAMEVSGSEVISPLVAQSTLVRHDKKVPSSSLLGPDQLRELQAGVPTWVQVGQAIEGDGERD
jgi:hypothetical protein